MKIFALMMAVGARKASGLWSSIDTVAGVTAFGLRWLESFAHSFITRCSRRHKSSPELKLPCEVDLGRNFVIDHFGGIVLHGGAKFGDNRRIRNGVVVGISHVGDSGAPIIGDNVDIGAGAKVLGPIRIGNNVLIGANAVVIHDIPDNCIAVGVPAVVKPRGQEIALTKLDKVVSRSPGGLKFGAVAIGRTEGERLKQCLQSLSEAAVVVYVDLRNDGSVQHAREKGAVVIELNLEIPFTAARARSGPSSICAKNILTSAMYNLSMATAKFGKAGINAPPRSSITRRCCRGLWAAAGA